MSYCGLGIRISSIAISVISLLEMFNSWEKVRSFLDMMDMSDLHSSLPPSSTSSSSSSSASFDSNQHPLPVDDRIWLVGEKTTRQILSVIQPTVYSETRRQETIEYLQRLIAEAFGIKVFPFGSVPFKTYLPHGDIDLTAISHYGTNEHLASEICTLLQNKEKTNPNIPVKDVLCVPAQVMVVKCTVSDIAVDISFNQTAGLCALYFLEQVDQYIGKDHLFKLSVILIKAWCYYESRLLGGFHGLISTYALETMILHVINLFHSSLHCPLAVLYKFLEYYSTFDWKKYCIGINGLVLISSLPKIEVVKLDDCDELLLTEEFLRSTKEALFPSNGDNWTKSPVFPVKYLNILDPLRDDNNLGRSVGKGNFFRIKSALSYGAQKLNDILTLPLEKIDIGIETFFKNTLERNGKGSRVDVLVPVPLYGSENTSVETDNNDILSGIQVGLWFDDYDMLGPSISVMGHGWNNNGWAEMGPGPIFQYDQNGYYDLEEYPPSSVDSRSDCYINNPILQERWNSRGGPPYQYDMAGHGVKNGGTNGEKWRSRRATSALVNNPRTNEINNGGFYDEKWKSKGVRSAYSYKDEFCLNQASFGDEKRKSRGTCAFIPQFDRLMPMNQSWEENPNREEYHKESVISNSNASSSDICENNSLVNYSMDEFPLLPGSKPIPIKAPPLAYKNSEPVVESSASSGSMETLSEGKLSDSDGSVFLDSPSDPPLVIEVVDEDKSSLNTEDKDSSKSEEKTVVTEQPLLLTDECEFPPLARPPEPVVTLSKKEFPPLRACLRSLKKNKWKK